MILKNVRAITPNGAVTADIVSENGIITFIGNTSLSGKDCTGLTALPGFTDTHVHGAFGTEFSASCERFDKGLTEEAKRGITSVCCTVRCLPLDETLSAIRNIVREYKKEPKGAKIRGIHLEGPFVSPRYIGSMNPSNLCKPDTETFRKMYDCSEGLLKIITIAPELDGADEVIKLAVSLGVTVSIGHTAADYKTAEKAFSLGASRMTHLFNAEPSFHHRAPSAVGFGLTTTGITCELICDFVHLEPAAIKLAYLAKGDSAINIISDSGVFAGLGDMEIVIAGKKRIIRDGVCRTEDGTIAGSCFTLHEGVKNLLREGYSFESVAKMASSNPASALGVGNETGTLEIGKRADICIIDSNFGPVCGYVGGECYE